MNNIQKAVFLSVAGLYAGLTQAHPFDGTKGYALESGPAEMAILRYTVNKEDFVWEASSGRLQGACKDVLKQDKKYDILFIEKQVPSADKQSFVTRFICK